jgi:hypothetical protein
MIGAGSGGAYLKNVDWRPERGCMSIQFYCLRCGAAIEVDDEFAGSRAECPHCRAVVPVPDMSTFRRDTPVAAPSSDGGDASAPSAPPPPPPKKPSTQANGPPATSSAPPPSQPALHYGQPLDHTTRMARKYGNIALVWMVATIMAYLFMVAMSIGIMVAHFTKENPGAGPEAIPSDLKIEESNRIIEASPQRVYIHAARVVSAVTGLLGLIYGVGSLRVRSRRNWRAWVAIVVCVPLLTCAMLDILIRLTMLLTGNASPTA